MKSRKKLQLFESFQTFHLTHGQQKPVTIIFIVTSTAAIHTCAHSAQFTYNNFSSSTSAFAYNNNYEASSGDSLLPPGIHLDPVPQLQKINADNPFRFPHRLCTGWWRAMITWDREWNGRRDIRGYWRKTFCSIMHTDKVQWEFGKSIFILVRIPFLLDTFQEWTVFRVEIFCQLLFQGQISFNSRTIRGPQVQ